MTYLYLDWGNFHEVWSWSFSHMLKDPIKWQKIIMWILIISWHLSSPPLWQWRVRERKPRSSCWKWQLKQIKCKMMTFYHNQKKKMYGNKYLIFIWFDINCPLMCMSIFIPLLSKITRNISINYWFHNGQTLKNNISLLDIARYHLLIILQTHYFRAVPFLW